MLVAQQGKDPKDPSRHGSDEVFERLVARQVQRHRQGVDEMAEGLTLPGLATGGRRHAHDDDRTAGRPRENHRVRREEDSERSVPPDRCAVPEIAGQRGGQLDDRRKPLQNSMLRPVHGKQLGTERGHLRQQIAEGAHTRVDPGLGVRGRHQRGMLTQFPRDAAPGIRVGIDSPRLSIKLS